MIIAGVVAGFGLWLIVVRFLPAHPNLAQALTLLNPLTDVARTEKPRGWQAVGQWGLNRLPPKLCPVPTADLALLGLTPAGFVARKIGYALAGLVLPSAAGVCLILTGVHLPVLALPIVALVCAGLGFMLPDVQIRAAAARARVEFSRTLACFVDLVALERFCGSGTKQALDTASTVGDSWVFTRLRETLDRSTWAGLTGWDGLRELAGDLALPDLSDVSDIIRLSGAEGAGIYRILRAKARSLREGLLLTDMTRANEANEKMSLPVSALGIVFLAILIGPALLSMMGSMP